MVIKKIEYFVEGKKHVIDAELCDTPWKKFRGLMFRKNSPPLFFIFKKEIRLTIHSFFCRPFKVIWLNKEKRTTQIIDVENWKPSINGTGKYLLEIPLSFNNNKSSTVK